MATTKSVVVVESHVDSEESKKLAIIANKIRAEGFVPKDVLYREYGDELATKAVALMYRQWRVVIEVTRKWEGKEVKGYEWANAKISAAKQKQMPPQAQFLVDLCKGGTTQYGDYKQVTVRCRYITPALGGIPNTSGDKNCFERNGGPCILRHNQRAMFSDALGIIGKTKSIAYQTRFSVISFDESVLKDYKRALPDVGVLMYESIPTGSEFTIDALVPTTHLSETEFVQAITEAGKRIGLSPARSAGHGDFEVMG